jgi:hypothetical protein
MVLGCEKGKERLKTRKHSLDFVHNLGLNTGWFVRGPPEWLV